MEIPIQNIYYLLCYAWNNLEERDIVDVKGIETTEICDLFAKVLGSGASRLLKMGLDRGYEQQNEEIPGIKGRVDFGLSLKRTLFQKAKAYCYFEDLSYNTLPNQILKTTMRRLIEVDELNPELREQLWTLCRKLREVDDIPISKSIFRLVQLHRNNSFYEFLLSICELVFDNLLPTEQKGHSKFRDFIREERQMSGLFEEFVRNFFKIEQSYYKVYREDIHWKVTESITTEGASFLPKMQTDVSLESIDKKIIIDTKYYREALTEYYDKEKIRTENMYQMYAYLQNLDATNELNKYCTGILLYPAVTKDLDINIPIPDHPVIIKTINLSQDWQNIHKDLLAVVGLS